MTRPGGVHCLTTFSTPDPALPPATSACKNRGYKCSIYKINYFLPGNPARSLKQIGPLIDYINESGIDATGLFYTEVEETGDAETYLKGALDYPPREQ
jgi:hypothetical protein